MFSDRANGVRTYLMNMYEYMAEALVKDASKLECVPVNGFQSAHQTSRKLWGA
ncbi:hypothetical protein [Teredinibacter haidensis]|uniref:hypothetical protein n=1 Tax=Teredinibacter haidensis TaxID=2731755 RepID=UPI000AD63BFA|nr:hypothetical protein [Teredinibacter haidensis]